MAPSGYNILMERKEIETVGIRVLRDNLSKFLERVALGVRILVTDRGRVIAELHAPGMEINQALNNDFTVFQNWIEQGDIKPGKAAAYDYKQALEHIKVKSPEGTWKSVLDKERGE